MGTHKSRFLACKKIRIKQFQEIPKTLHKQARALRVLNAQLVYLRIINPLACDNTSNGRAAFFC